MWKDPNCIRWSCTVCRTFWRWLDSSELNYVRFVSHCVRYVALLVRFVAVFEDDWIRQSLFSKFSKSNSLEFNKILWINFGKIPVTSGRFSIWPAGTGSENFDRKFRSDRKWPEFRSVTSLGELVRRQRDLWRGWHRIWRPPQDRGTQTRWASYGKGCDLNSWKLQSLHCVAIEEQGWETISIRIMISLVILIWTWNRLDDLMWYWFMLNIDSMILYWPYRRI